jgi:hypothetical protein
MQKNLLLVDVVGQGSIILGCFIVGLVSWAFDVSETGRIVPLAVLTLGGWQMISAILLGILRENQARRYYLGVSFLFLVFGIPGGFLLLGGYDLLGGLGAFLGLMILFFVPLVLAVWYFIISAKDLATELNRPRSFWDLQV